MNALLKKSSKIRPNTKIIFVHFGKPEHDLQFSVCISFNVCSRAILNNFANRLSFIEMYFVILNYFFLGSLTQNFTQV